MISSKQAVWGLDPLCINRYHTIPMTIHYRGAGWGDPPLLLSENERGVSVLFCPNGKIQTRVFLLGWLRRFLCFSLRGAFHIKTRPTSTLSSTLSLANWWSASYTTGHLTLSKLSWPSKVTSSSISSVTLFPGLGSPGRLSLQQKVWLHQNLKCSLYLNVKFKCNLNI